MKNSRVLILAVMLLFVSLLGFAVLQYFSSLVEPTDTGKSFSSLGEQIYFSGRGQSGRRLSYDYGANWLRMHGGGCSSCHGDDGKGGFELMMSDEEAPAITWAALTEEEHNEHGEDGEHLPYNERTIKRAITQGLNPAGRQLDSIMPRWEMNTEELNAIIVFLKKLD